MAKEPPASEATPTGTHAAGRLLANHTRIVELWSERLRERSAAAARTDQAVLTDVVPGILRQLAEALSAAHPRRTATEGGSLAEEHGGERVRLTSYTIGDLVTEFRILHQVLLEVLEAKAPLTGEERAIVDSSIDEALMKSCAGYTLVQAESRERHFAFLAHDLRNPLSVARASAGLILRKPASDQVPRWAAKAIEAVDRADRMVQDLLDVMRLEAGRGLPLELEECDFVELVHDTVDGLRSEHGDRFVLVAHDAIRGHCSPRSFRRAVENLLTNAVKYGATNRPITVTMRQKFGRMLLVVHNEGAHIPAEQQESLFRAFERAHATEKTSRGWGLGLAQVRGVAEAHGGSITVDSLPETGTSFTLDLPVDARPYQGAFAHRTDEGA